jgi:chromate transport protein ChrA
LFFVGILVAATLKYADSIIRNFATAGSIVLSTIIGFFYLGGIVDLTVIIGIVCTVVAMFNYTMDTTVPPDVLPVAKRGTSAVDSAVDAKVALDQAKLSK